MQMYLPFCGIAISNAQLFAASRKEYDRSRVSAKCVVGHHQTFLFLQVPGMHMCLLSRQLYFKNFIFKRPMSWLRQQAESVGGKYTCRGGCCFVMPVPRFVVLKQLHLWHRRCRRKCYLGRVKKFSKNSNPKPLPSWFFNIHFMYK